MLHGAFRDRLERRGLLPLETPWRSNLVVWSALDLIGALLCNRSTGIAYLAVGAGDPAWDANPPAPDRGRTHLTAELFRVRLEPGDSLTYNPATGRVHVSVSLRRGEATGTLRELGLFGGGASARPGSGVLVNHAVHAPVEKGQMVGAQYRMEGNITSIVKEVKNIKDVYYKFNLQLWNIRNGLLEWSDEKEIRKTTTR